MSNPMALHGFLPAGWQDEPFEPFAPGVEVSYLLRGTPEVALLRYEKGAAVPRHRHPGLETILVLEGSQSDERGRYGPGTLVFNPPGSEHSVWSEEGCTVLIHWEKPVEFTE